MVKALRGPRGPLIWSHMADVLIERIMYFREDVGGRHGFKSGKLSEGQLRHHRLCMSCKP